VYILVNKISISRDIRGHNASRQSLQRHSPRRNAGHLVRQKRLPQRARLLEVAPGPGYLAIELARLGPHQITGLDISQSFVRIATAYAQQAGVDVEFRRGDAAALPFAGDSFDFVVCRAAFKNFSNPVGALTEIYRVLRPGGEALIIDMRNDATDTEIDTAVEDMHLDRLNTFLTRMTFKHMLRKRAYSIQDFQAMVAATPFHEAEIETGGLIGLDVWLKKQSAEAKWKQ